MALRYQDVSVLPLARYAAILGDARMHAVMARIAEVRAKLVGRVVWNVSSSAVGGGVAEMVRSLLAYARGAGVDARWVILEAPPAFFRITKRLHNALHGSAGDGSPLGDGERALYEHVAAETAAALAPMIRPGDVVIVHDPQPAGLIAPLCAVGARVVWRCHIGHDEINDEVERGWRFLAPYVRPAAGYVFSRAAYVPRQLDPARAVVIPPSIDPFSAKNQPMAESAVVAILAHTGILAGAATVADASVFVREDGTPGRVDRAADVVRDAPAPSWDTPLVVQVSRWDRLKDPLGVLRGFVRIPPAVRRGAMLVLAGPGTRSVADDPEGAAVYAEVLAAWRALGDLERAQVSLVALPTADVDENAAIVNALQRHATVIVQKSLNEGFGLTVTEAMWKERPVVASAVGGIRDQIVDGVDGLLVGDPRDLDAFAAAVERLLGDAALRRRLGDAGHARVLGHYLGIDSLLRYGALIERLDREAVTTAAAPAAR